jgi:large subunit ribosomal protein L15
MPLQRRLPKRGFKNRFRIEYTPVNLSQLATVFGAGEQVDATALKSKGMMPRKSLRFKVLGTGELPHALTILAQGASKSAAEKVAAAGGSLEIVAPVVRKAADRQQEGK